jgi:hypothetical protein
VIAELLGRLAPASGPATEVQATARRRRAWLFMGIGIVALLVIGGLTTPSFLTLENLLVVIRAASITASSRSGCRTSRSPAISLRCPLKNLRSLRRAFSLS